MRKQHKQENMRRLFKDIITNKALSQVIEQAKGKAIVPVIGITGAGKTALSLYLSGHEMEEAEVINTCIVPKDPSLREKVSHDDSKTSTPDLFSSDGIYFADCPGFKDRRGSQKKIEASLSTQLLFESAFSIKALIVVIPGSVFTTGDRSIKLEELSLLLGKIVDLHSIGASVRFVITHSESISISRSKKRNRRSRLEHIGAISNRLLSQRSDDYKKELAEATEALTGKKTSELIGDYNKVEKTLQALLAAISEDKSNNRQRSRITFLGVDDWLSDVARNEVFEWLEELHDPIDKALFHFTDYDEYRLAFDKQAEMILWDSNHLFSSWQSLRRQHELRRKDIDENVFHNKIKESVTLSDINEVSLLQEKVDYFINHKQDEAKQLRIEKKRLVDDLCELMKSLYENIKNFIPENEMNYIMMAASIMDSGVEFQSELIIFQKAWDQLDVIVNRKNNIKKKFKQRTLLDMLSVQNYPSPEDRETIRINAQEAKSFVENMISSHQEELTQPIQVGLKENLSCVNQLVIPEKSLRSVATISVYCDKKDAFQIYRLIEENGESSAHFLLFDPPSLWNYLWPHNLINIWKRNCI